ncbi:SET domain-containing protein [Obba rivulosa]|uniref:SET domain-containing protein n=1 Tax=Obba rivulosa TaxID=1052685 RepID=A0A8E2AZE2_9APHY|nr:SET domain-containing protein [Obba rivulosa]
MPQDDTSTNELQSPAPLHTTPSTLEIRINPASGRSCYATRTVPAGYTVLAARSPYAYTIWKPFRNEVCAECWRYDQGNRSFLTRRDDEGLEEERKGPVAVKENGRGEKTGAGLWFCDAECQASWLAREGRQMVDLLRTLEGARRAGKTMIEVSDRQDEATKLTKEAIEHTWDTVRQEERSPKVVRRWRENSLNDFETDLARYILLALAHFAREYTSSMASLQQTQELACPRNDTLPGLNGECQWDTFASLQCNELQYLRTYPELLENHIRIYKALKSRFMPAALSDRTPGRIDRPVIDVLASLITVGNVRTALGIDPGNSFGIWEAPLTEESECLGFAVYPGLSFFNHHCAPNVRKERDGRALRFVTTREVGEGEELCISYGQVEGMTWRERRKELSDGWFFDCACGRCIADIAAEMQAQQLST